MKRLILITSICVCLAMGMVLNNCGYKLSGFSKQIPDHIKTIIIPDFENKTTRFQAEQFITFAVRDEFIKRSDLVLVGATWQHQPAGLKSRTPSRLVSGRFRSLNRHTLFDSSRS